MISADIVFIIKIW